MRTPIYIAGLICWSLGYGAEVAEPTAKSHPLPPATNAVANAGLPPLPKSRIAYFRELLAMSPPQRDQALAGTPESNRKIIEAKLREYAALPPEERETRLRTTELHWYLRPLMVIAPTNRAALVAAIPDEFQKLIAERLQRWEALPRQTQKELLENDWATRYLSTPPSQRNSTPNDISPPLPEKLEKQLASWQLLPPDRRQRMFDRFGQYFDLSSKEKERTLGALSDTERSEMEKTLQAFEKLPSAQRWICVNSFQKFADMTPGERAQFLKNAELWRKMSPGERQTWRLLVTKLPPLPPGFGEPPTPPGFQKQKSGPTTPPFPPAKTNPANPVQ